MFCKDFSLRVEMTIPRSSCPLQNTIEKTIIVQYLNRNKIFKSTMCGIAGIFHLDHRPIILSQIRRMADLLRHRGPDDEGFAFFNTNTGESLHLKGPDSPIGINLPDITQFSPLNFHNLALSERRLAIQDLSPAGHTPMTSPDGIHTISYNGEIFNFIELRNELRTFGHRFNSSGDTEVLLAAYRQWGAECVSRFNGMWAFAIWDAHKRELFCARDRFGVKPFYYVLQDNTFAFASEPKALWASGLIAPKPNSNLLMDFLAGYEASANDECMFDGIRQLPPAHSMIVTTHAIHIERYWSLPINPDLGPRKLDAKIIMRVGELLTDAVRLRLRSDVPVGTCLSGGLDSSAIVVLANKLMHDEHTIARALVGEHQKTFTACYADRESDEREYAEMIVQQTGAQWHQTFPSADGLAADLDAFIWHSDEPPITSSIYAQWCVMRKVHEQGVVVTLDGQGSDELLAGYLPFDVYLAQMLRSWQFARFTKEARAIATVGSRNITDVLKRALAFQLPKHWQRRIQASQTTRMLGLPPESAAQAICRHEYGFEDSRVNLPQHLAMLTRNNLPRLLRVEDRNSMAFGIEARTPFLDFRFAEYVSQLPASYRIHAGWTKYALRAALNNTLPKAITWRRDKKGFATPERAWLKTLQPRMINLMNDRPRIGPMLDMKVVHSIVNSGLFETDRVAAASVWRWLAAELWLRMLENHTNNNISIPNMGG